MDDVEVHKITTAMGLEADIVIPNFTSAEQPGLQAVADVQGRGTYGRRGRTHGRHGSTHDHRGNGSQGRPPAEQKFPFALRASRTLSLTYPPDPKVGQAGKIFVVVTLGLEPNIVITDFTSAEQPSPSCD